MGKKIYDVQYFSQDLLNFKKNSALKHCFLKFEAGDVLSDVLIFLAISATLFL